MARPSSALSLVRRGLRGLGPRVRRIRWRRVLWITLPALGAILAVSLIGLYAGRDWLVARRGLPLLARLTGGSVESEAIHLDLFPPRLTATGVRVRCRPWPAPSRCELRVVALTGDVTLEGIEIRRDESTESWPILAAARIDVHADHHRIRTAPYIVDELTIHEPSLRLRFVSTGRTNLQALFDPGGGRHGAPSATVATGTPRVVGTAPQAPQAPPRPGGMTSFTPPPPLFLLRHGEIRDGTIVYDDPLSDAVHPVHLELHDVDVVVHDFQIRGAPLAGPLADVTLDAHVDQLTTPALVHARAWLEPWRDLPSLTVLAVVTGFDLANVQPYIPDTGRTLLGGRWLHVALDLRARAAQIQQGVVEATVAESGDQLGAYLAGSLFHPTIDRNSALVSAFRLPLGQFLRFGDVGMSVAGELALAGLDSMLRLGQGAVDAGAAAATDPPALSPGAHRPPEQDLLSRLGRGVTAFASGVADAAKRLFERSSSGYTSATTPARPMSDILAEFEPRHRQLRRAFLAERIHVARTVDPARLAELEQALTAIPPGARPPGVTTRGAVLGTGQLASP
ncbi:MAG: hypothetical protein IPK07_24225 [Deltaproteobacteria bacterium]|nr:hypothetical protein [Deltaproteobacteria bacterium]